MLRCKLFTILVISLIGWYIRKAGASSMNIWEIETPRAYAYTRNTSEIVAVTVSMSGAMKSFRRRAFTTMRKYLPFTSMNFRVSRVSVWFDLMSRMPENVSCIRETSSATCANALR